MKEAFTGTRLHMECYMFMSGNKLIKTAGRREAMKGKRSVKDEELSAMNVIR